MITEVPAGTEGDKWLCVDSMNSTENFYLGYIGRGKYILYLSDQKKVKGITLRQAHSILQNWEDWKGLKVSVDTWIKTLTDSWVSRKLAQS